MTSHDVEVAIVGGGAAGIAATRRLHDAGVRCLLIEARARLGGRAWSVTDASGFALDLGCGWLHSADRNPWSDIAKAQGRTIDKTPPPWMRRSSPIGFPIAEQQDYLEAGRAFHERLEHAERTPDQPAAAFLTPGDRWNQLITAVNTFVTGAELTHVSAHDLVRYEDSDENWRVVEGLGATVAAHGAGLPAVFGCPVTRINRSGTRLRAETSQGAITADQIIIAVPAPVLTEPEFFAPALPEKIEAALGLPLGHDDKLFLVARKRGGVRAGQPPVRAHGSRRHRHISHAAVRPADDRGLFRRLARRRSRSRRRRRVFRIRNGRIDGAARQRLSRTASSRLACTAGAPIHFHAGPIPTHSRARPTCGRFWLLRSRIACSLPVRPARCTTFRRRTALCSRASPPPNRSSRSERSRTCKSKTWTAGQAAITRSNSLCHFLHRAADAVLDDDAVLLRQHARRIVRRDADAGEQRAVVGREQPGQLLQARLVLDVQHALDAAAARDLAADRRRRWCGSPACRSRRRGRCRTPRSARLFGFCTPMVARLPIPISISPSPVMTATRAFGFASARPSPIIAAPPIAPQR